MTTGRINQVAAERGVRESPERAKRARVKRTPPRFTAFAPRGTRKKNEFPIGEPCIFPSRSDTEKADTLEIGFRPTIYQRVSSGPDERIKTLLVCAMCFPFRGARETEFALGA